MNKLRRAALAVAAILALPPALALTTSQQLASLSGPGTQTCTQFAPDSAEEVAAVHWTHGFLIAMELNAQSRDPRVPSLDVIRTKLREQCQTFPKEKLFTHAVRLSASVALDKVEKLERTRNDAARKAIQGK